MGFQLIQKNPASGGGGIAPGSAASLKSLILTSPDANTALVAGSGFSLTGSNDQSMVDLAGTFNTTGNPTGFKLNVTNTASGGSSKVFDFQVNGVSRFSMGMTGRLRSNAVDNYAIYEFANSIRGIGYDVPSEQMLFYCNQIGGIDAAVGSAGFTVQGLEYAGFNLTSGNWAQPVDVRIRRGGPNILQIGQNHATTPTAQTLKAHDVTTGTGADLILKSGTGSVADGNVKLHGANRASYDASPTVTSLRDILVAHGLMEEFA